ncbi:hypothetical protein H257_04152 [Aphanomyces astaci]|uniref:Uncharacterized protein n=1 Tax=Aphanomyces astaci TaxID=112090 RepID=W4GUL1_APHAT|nr:hypothetical protein H257_04152 [Aphanomyces astaci]ETV83425.1 hypothetical protein H257_04152 [Aphanomyces astaci]|eukprot:XP_009826855.1 hypothetical protein H257_04152 [Aphanomyces astaci]
MTWTAVVEVWHRQSDPIVLSDGLGAVLDHPQTHEQHVVGVVHDSQLLVRAVCVCRMPRQHPVVRHLPQQHAVALKCTGQATNSYMLAMGDNLASIFSLRFAAFIPDDLNDSHLEYMCTLASLASRL